MGRQRLAAHSARQGRPPGPAAQTDGPTGGSGQWPSGPAYVSSTPSLHSAGRMILARLGFKPFAAPTVRSRMPFASLAHSDDRIMWGHPRSTPPQQTQPARSPGRTASGPNMTFSPPLSVSTQTEEDAGSARPALRPKQPDFVNTPAADGTRSVGSVPVLPFTPVFAFSSPCPLCLCLWASLRLPPFLSSSGEPPGLAPFCQLCWGD